MTFNQQHITNIQLWTSNKVSSWHAKNEKISFTLLTVVYLFVMKKKLIKVQKNTFQLKIIYFTKVTAMTDIIVSCFLFDFDLPDNFASTQK